MKIGLFPHPVLGPGREDYKNGCIFDIKVIKPNYTLDNKILVTINFELDSHLIKNYIKNNKAKICIVIQCSKTYKRNVYFVEGDFFQKKLNLELANYIDKITIVSYITTTCVIESFKSAEHNSEYTEPITVPTGTILAYSSEVILTIDSLKSINAAIRLLTRDTLTKGEYVIDVSDDYIDIYMHDETKKYVEQLRKSEMTKLYNSVYMVALIHAMQNLESNPDTKWAEGLKSTLVKNNIAMKDLKIDAYKYAQKLLKYPLGPGEVNTVG